MRLRQLGASLAMEPGFGDDGTPNGGVFRDLDQWLESTLLPTLTTIFPSAYVPSPLKSQAICPPPYSVKVLLACKSEESPTKEEWQRDRYSAGYHAFFARQQPLSAYSYDKATHQRITADRSDRDKQELLVGRVVENRRLTPLDWEQNTVHLRIEVNPDVAAPVGLEKNGENDTPLSDDLSLQKHLDALPYRAGDVAAILPSNSPKEVTAFLEVLPQELLIVE